VVRRVEDVHTVLHGKNFEQFQHYKDRNPPWIKLWTRLLDDYEFNELSKENQRDLMMI
jgi:hypothetical protein